MQSYLQDLNDAQKQAVINLKGPVMIIAGPGSGKTRVLTNRVAYMIEEGINPWQILALTFTNKAARELVERISHTVGPKSKQVWAGTFHSIFARILRIEASKIGYPSDFTIYDTDDTKSVISEILNEFQLSKTEYNPNSVRSRISSAKSNLITPSMYAQDAKLMEQDKMNKMPLIHMIYKRYIDKCQMGGAMDFDDLLLQLFRLFQENPDNVVEKYRNHFKYVLVDEFQDTNYLQYAILKKLVLYPGSERNVSIVGDDAQSIYSFRGATISNILDFERDFPDVKIFKLEQNYRSTDFIVQAANDVITNNRKQIKKSIWTEQKEGHKIKLIKAVSDVEEGRRIADYIIELKNRHHLSNRQIAILYRTNAQSRIFEEHLRRVNILYKVFGGQSFYQRKEIKDLLAYFRLAVNPKDNEALKRVINLPKRGIGNTTVDKFLGAANQQNLALWDIIQHAQLGGKAGNALHNFVSIIKDVHAKVRKADAYDLALSIYKMSGLAGEMRSDMSAEGIGRMENVQSLLDGIKEFTEHEEVDEANLTEDRSLASYIQSIALITDQDDTTEEQDYITLMSVHAAKGLEFDAVMVSGLEENLFPSYLSVSDPEQLDEERRLFYVAITRARSFLTLSYATTRYQFGQMRMNEPSRFIDEIDESRYHKEVHTRIAQLEDEITRTKFVLKPLRQKPNVQDVFDDFQASPTHLIQAGMTILHQKFGKGKVQSIDGHADNKVATIYFPELDDMSQRKIMLKFAKLKIIEEQPEL